MAHLLVVRHGETDWNRERRVQGHTDVPLNATGREQALAAGEKLAEELGGELLPIFTSDLRRAKHTARILGRQLGITPKSTRHLRERQLGILEGKTWAELRETHPDVVHAYKVERDFDAIPEAEPQAAFRRRSLGAALAVARRAERAVVVTHGGVIRMLLVEALGPQTLCMIANTAVYRFEVEPSSTPLLQVV